MTFFSLLSVLLQVAASSSHCASWAACEAQIRAPSTSSSHADDDPERRWVRSLFGLAGSVAEASEYARLAHAVTSLQLSRYVAQEGGSLVSKLLTFPFTLHHALHLALGPKLTLKRARRHRRLVVHVAGWAATGGEEAMSTEDHRYKLDRLLARVLRQFLPRDISRITLWCVGPDVPATLDGIFWNFSPPKGRSLKSRGKGGLVVEVHFIRALYHVAYERHGEEERRRRRRARTTARRGRRGKTKKKAKRIPFGLQRRADLFFAENVNMHDGEWVFEYPADTRSTNSSSTTASNGRARSVTCRTMPFRGGLVVPRRLLDNATCALREHSEASTNAAAVAAAGTTRTGPLGEHNDIQTWDTLGRNTYLGGGGGSELDDEEEDEEEDERSWAKQGTMVPGACSWLKTLQLVAHLGIPAVLTFSHRLERIVAEQKIVQLACGANHPTSGKHTRTEERKLTSTEGESREKADVASAVTESESNVPSRTAPRSDETNGDGSSASNPPPSASSSSSSPSYAPSLVRVAWAGANPFGDDLLVRIFDVS